MSWHIENTMGIWWRKALRWLGMDSSAAVSFAQAVQDSLQARRGRRVRTLDEIRSICSRLMQRVPGLSTTQVRHITRADCAVLVQTARTPRQQHKLRVILHGVFAHCVRQEWCRSNPAALLVPPMLSEQEIVPLNLEEIRQLLNTARRQPFRACMPALGLMLWAGVRPAEVQRLQWGDIDWEDSVITLRPCHSKTGGCRHVQLQPALRAWLREHGMLEQGAICPRNWQRRWRHLRQAAGLIPWRQDVLRHTFASYYVKHFHDYARLQEEMGHRSAALLRTRYLNMRGITAAHAALFWKAGAL